MDTVYKILDPKTGEYADAATLDECLEKVAETALALYMAQTYDAPYSVCTTHEDGTETWTRPDGTHTLSMQEKIKKVRERVGVMLSSIPPTPVETLP